MIEIIVSAVVIFIGVVYYQDNNIQNDKIEFDLLKDRIRQ